MSNQTPLYSALVQHHRIGRSAFHTPGHSGKPISYLNHLLELDVTELPDTDSLFEAEHVILQAEHHAAQVFGTTRTLFSAGGCTLCIQAMLRLVSADSNKKTILTDRILHRSAVNAMALLDLHPVWLLPRADAGLGFPGRIHSDDVEALLKQYQDVAAVYITSPDYFGVLADIKSISEVCHRYHVPLLVDNAHGSHLFLTPENLHPIHLGADMTACSAHKTLPVLTGGAFLNIASDIYAANAKDAMALFGSTSPSYPIMASLDLCMQWAETKGKEAYLQLQKRVVKMKEMAAAKGIAIPLGETDPVRITLQTASLGITGEEAAEIFRDHFVEPEYADNANLVLITTPFHTEQDFLRVEQAIQALPNRKPLKLNSVFPSLPNSVMSVRQAVFSAWEEIDLEDSVGRIAATTACPCPPGVPVVMPGEMITEEIVMFLKNYRFLTIKVVK
ncbi:MAG: aminotransferase class V-fold PLP-dependent enzyme [Clostridium sp.]|nr:aminotransferase class V-fold PLP-dependent enzyme [Clostridium sp.]